MSATLRFDWRAPMAPPLWEGVNVKPATSPLAWTLRLGSMTIWCYRVRPKGYRTDYRIDYSDKAKTTHVTRHQVMEKLCGLKAYPPRLADDVQREIREKFESEVAALNEGRHANEA